MWKFLFFSVFHSLFLCFHSLHSFKLAFYLLFRDLTGTFLLARRLMSLRSRCAADLNIKKRVEEEKTTVAAVELIREEKNPHETWTIFFTRNLCFICVTYIDNGDETEAKWQKETSSLVVSRLFFCGDHEKSSYFLVQILEREMGHIERSRKEFWGFTSRNFLCSYVCCIGGMRTCHSQRCFLPPSLSWHCFLLAVNHDRFMFTIYSKLDWERQKGGSFSQREKKVQFAHNEWWAKSRVRQREKVFQTFSVCFSFDSNFFFFFFLAILVPTGVFIQDVKRESEGRGMSNFLQEFHSFKHSSFRSFMLESH